MEAEFLLQLLDDVIALLVGRTQFLFELLANVLQLLVVAQANLLHFLQLPQPIRYRNDAKEINSQSARRA